MKKLITILITVSIFFMFAQFLQYEEPQEAHAWGFFPAMITGNGEAAAPSYEDFLNDWTEVDAGFGGYTATTTRLSYASLPANENSYYYKANAETGTFKYQWVERFTTPFTDNAIAGGIVVTTDLGARSAMISASADFIWCYAYNDDDPDEYVFGCRFYESGSQTEEWSYTGSLAINTDYYVTLERNGTSHLVLTLCTVSHGCGVPLTSDTSTNTFTTSTSYVEVGASRGDGAGSTYVTGYIEYLDLNAP